MACSCQSCKTMRKELGMSPAPIYSWRSDKKGVPKGRPSGSVFVRLFKDIAAEARRRGVHPYAICKERGQSPETYNRGRLYAAERAETAAMRYDVIWDD